MALAKETTFAIVAREKETEAHLKKFLKSKKYSLSKTPDYVIAAGGDGTVLLSERMFQGVPKLVLRDKSICNNCMTGVDHITHAFSEFEKGNFSVREEMMLEAKWNGKRLLALNEIQVRNKNPVEAIRFMIALNGKPTEDIGDGLIVSTPYGSSGYYFSSTGEKFSQGIGVAFNNSHKRNKNIVIDENSEVEMVVTRGSGVVCYDNDQKHIFTIKENQKITIRKAKEKAKFILLRT